jgi:hypothetical protein
VTVTVKPSAQHNAEDSNTYKVLVKRHVVPPPFIAVEQINASVYGAAGAPNGGNTKRFRIESNQRKQRFAKSYQTVHPPLAMLIQTEGSNQANREILSNLSKRFAMARSRWKLNLQASTKVPGTRTTSPSHCWQHGKRAFVRETGLTCGTFSETQPSDSSVGTR